MKTKVKVIGLNCGKCPEVNIKPNTHVCPACGAELTGVATVILGLKCPITGRYVSLYAATPNCNMGGLCKTNCL